MASTLSKIRFLIRFMRIPPEMWDFIFPHGPVLKSQAIREYVLAGVTRDIALQITNRDMAEKVKSIGRSMAKFAATNLVAGWEDGDDLCPTWHRIKIPIHFPVPVPDPEPYSYLELLDELNPQPLPPKWQGNALRVIAGLTQLREEAEQLQELGTQLSREQHFN